MGKRPLTNASIRTTTAPTLLEAGVKDNVLPSRARTVVNFRTLHGDSAAVVLAHVRAAVGDPRAATRAIEHTLNEALPNSPLGLPAYQRFERAILRSYPGAIVVPGRVLGATDSNRGPPYLASAGAAGVVCSSRVRGAENTRQSTPPGRFFAALPHRTRTQGPSTVL